MVGGVLLILSYSQFWNPVVSEVPAVEACAHNLRGGKANGDTLTLRISEQRIPSGLNTWEGWKPGLPFIFKELNQRLEVARNLKLASQRLIYRRLYLFGSRLPKNVKQENPSGIEARNAP